MAVQVTGNGDEVRVADRAWVVNADQAGRSVEIADETQYVIVEAQEHSVKVGQDDEHVSASAGVIVGGIPYLGEYEADAMFSEQVFPTRLRTMANDFTVHAINYTEAPNDSGITVTIGG